MVVGVYALPRPELEALYGEAAVLYTEEHAWLKKVGVTVLSQERLRTDPHAFRNALKCFPAQEIYVSLDMDVCASPRIPAVRFPDAEGLNREELIKLASQLRAFYYERGIPLSGVDIMEIDVHLLDVEPLPDIKNETAATAVAFLETLLAESPKGIR